MIEGITAKLDSIFHPRSIAIVGASKREGSFGHLLLDGVLRMGSKNVYPVNPRETELLGLKAYPNIKAIPYEIDIAVLLIPSGAAVEVVQECVDRGVKGIVLFASGFGEKSESGKQIELEIAELVRNSGSRLIGPNTNGIYCPSAGLLTLPGCLMSGGLTTESGNLSIFAQSGSFTDFLCQTLTRKNIMINKAMSLGNGVDLGPSELLEYFGEDKDTRIIAGYLEGTKDGRRLFELAKDISKQKPIIIWKGGITETGAKAAMAHTGSLAGATQVWETMFKQAGIINVNSFEEMVDCILALSWLPMPTGKRIAILSNMGGTNIGTTDNCIRAGLEIAILSEDSCQRLGKLLPAVGTSVANPLDMGVQTILNQNVYGEAMKIVAEDENVDLILVIADPDLPTAITSIADTAGEIGKPCAVALFDIPGLSEAYSKLFLEKHIPIYAEAKRAAFAMSKLCNYAAYRIKAIA